MTQVDLDARVPLVLLSAQVVAGPLAAAAERGATRAVPVRSVRPLCIAAGQVLGFQVGLRADEEVLWMGARESCFGVSWSRAVIRPTQPGTYRVVAEIFGHDFKLRRRALCVLEVV